MADYAIEVGKVVKKFGSFTAVDGVDIKIKKGEIFGLLGPNGAGKSTTINMLLGLLTPTSGRVFINGVDMQKNPEAAKIHIGVVAQETVVEPELTAEQNLRLFGRLYHVPDARLNEKIDFLLKLVELKDFKKSFAGTFSGGMKRRLEMIKALVHDPPIMLLDEPTTGLDIQNRTRIWNLLRQMNKERNVTILMTTQYLDEADMMCNRIAIIDHGKIIAIGSPAELKQMIGGGNIIEVAAPKEDLPRVEKEFRAVGLSPETISTRVSAAAGKDAAKKLEKLMQKLRESGVEVESVSIHEPTMDDVFLKLTGESVRDTTSSDIVGGRSAAMLRMRR
jgi:ABC-2 type transport system ATP-binding protein